MQPVDIAYAAGLIDGEGCIGIALEKKGGAGHSPTHRPYLTVAMTTEAPIRWLHEAFGLGSVNLYGRKGPNRRPAWTWRINGLAVRSVCDLIMPFLKVKGLQAYLIVCFYEEGLWISDHGKRVPAEEIDRRESVKQEIHRANARGLSSV